MIMPLNHEAESGVSRCAAMQMAMFYVRIRGLAHCGSYHCFLTIYAES